MKLLARARRIMRFHVLGLVIPLLALSTPTSASAQIEHFAALTSSLNHLATQLDEVSFNLAGLTETQLANTRTQVCELFSSEVAGHVANAIDSSQKDIPTESGAESLIRVTMNGNEFSSFLSQEEEYLVGDNKLSLEAWNLVLLVATAQRGEIASINSAHRKEVARAKFSALTGNNFRAGRQLLCTDSHSPANNTSNATWLSWTWAAGELLVGSTMFFGNLVLVPEPTIKSVSMFFGGIITSNGYSELRELMPI